MRFESPPGYEQFSDNLWTLLSSYPPPFIYIRDIESTKTTFSVVQNLLQALFNAPSSESSSKVHYACVDAVLCFTPRLIFESIIHPLVGWEPRWEDGCAIWSADKWTGQMGRMKEQETPEEDEDDGVRVALRWNENVDMFLNGLRAAHALLSKSAVTMRTNDKKGKRKAEESTDGEYDNVRFVIVVERPEKLKEAHPELMVPFTRLAGLARIDLTVIFISQVGWEDVRPPLAASPDPFYIDVPSPSKENIEKMLIASFANFSTSSDDILKDPYHPSLSSLYSHFVNMVCNVCYPFTHDPQEIQYIAAARWVGFIKPILDDYKSQRDETERGMDIDDDDLQFISPSEDLRIRLIKFFNSSLTTAMEALLPRQTNALDWALTNEPPDNLLTMTREEVDRELQLRQPVAITERNSLLSLPRMSKFILVASFLASMNPAKSDLRMFGRGLDEKKRKRRTMKTERRTKSGVVAKIPQRLLGPAAFPIDRMIAILGALLEENDADNRPRAPEFRIPGEYTDSEISRIGIYSGIMELSCMGLLHRTSPLDRLDGPPMFKCGVTYESLLGLAKDLDLSLNDLLWEPM